MHRLPQIGAFDVDRGIVHQQLVLAGGEVRENRGDMALRRFVAVEIAAHLRAERDDSEQLARRSQITPS